MIDKTRTKLVVISGLLLVAGAAAADDKPRDMFADLDTNKDGVITHEEAMAKVRAKFAEFDKNKDGYLELAELPKEMPVPERMEKRMEKMKERMEERAERRGEEFDPEDLERRGKPTRIQFIARHDRDGDERVSLEEFADRAIGHFKRADINGDGKVTKEEANEARSHHFGKKEGKHPGRR
ncbi:MAG: hypothetical protein EP335_05920 [Alphaproteobacteria bacterium]|nr:MAG: hypothetical protein EP335_05920 [Alphaproteobacteria bacterium]